MNTDHHVASHKPFTLLTIVFALCCFGCSSTHPTKDPSSAMTMKTSSNAAVVKNFFTQFGNGNLEGVVASFHPQAKITAVRNAPRKEGELHGTYWGHEGARAFLATLGNTFQTESFSVDNVVADGDVVFASGSFMHRLKKTQKVFSSDWALKCIVQDGAIREYHFFEDSLAFAEASN